MDYGHVTSYVHVFLIYQIYKNWLEYLKLLLIRRDCLGDEYSFCFVLPAIQNSLNCELNREKDLRQEAEGKERAAQESDEKGKQLVADLQTKLKDIRSAKVANLLKLEVIH